MILTHPCGIRKSVPEGFSFTTLLFGLFVPLLRGDAKWFIIFLATAFLNYGLCMIVVGFFTTPLWWLLSALYYNEWYRDDLLLKGFKA